MPRQYSLGFRPRALRLLDTMMEASETSEFEAIKSVASNLGVLEESVRRRRRKAQVDAGERPGTTSSEHAETAGSSVRLLNYAGLMRFSRPHRLMWVMLVKCRCCRAG